jgi:hypothetical protein
VLFIILTLKYICFSLNGAFYFFMFLNTYLSTKRGLYLPPLTSFFFPFQRNTDVVFLQPYLGGQQATARTTTAVPREAAAAGERQRREG